MRGLFFLTYSYSPLHAGIGQSMGKVDLPIEREKHTTYPCVYATGLKGALRRYCETKIEQETDTDKKEILNQEIKSIFGDEGAAAGAGGAIFTDLKILLFPVRSSKGGFKWVTSEAVLNRFKNDFVIAGGDHNNLANFDKIKKAELSEDEQFDPQKHLLLEDFMLSCDANAESSAKLFNLSAPDIPVSSIYKVDELLFKHLVNNATQIIARNILDENKTSKNLWYEEALPSDTVMYSFILPSSASNGSLNGTIKDCLNDKICQIGGNETVGYGITKIKFLL